MPNNLEENSKSAQDLFYAIINEEEQYSLWSSYKTIPEGWKKKYGPAPKEECLSYVEKLWTDMRPLRLRRKMVELEKKS